MIIDNVKINIDPYIKLLKTKCQIVGTFNKKRIKKLQKSVKLNAEVSYV